MMECGGVAGSCGSRALTGNVGAPSKGAVEGAAMQSWAGRGIRHPPTEEEEVFGELRAPGEAGEVGRLLSTLRAGAGCALWGKEVGGAGARGECSGAGYRGEGEAL